MSVVGIAVKLGIEVTSEAGKNGAKALGVSTKFSEEASAAFKVVNQGIGDAIEVQYSEDNSGLSKTEKVAVSTLVETVGTAALIAMVGATGGAALLIVGGVLVLVAANEEALYETYAQLKEVGFDALNNTLESLNNDIYPPLPSDSIDTRRCHPSEDVNLGFSTARFATERRDPLTFDLDGDGLETIGINSANPILFDHTGDGIKTATGWIKPDDGFLVLDRNGNGTIDNGTELFGDSTPLLVSDGNVIGQAEDGFDALAQEDTNGDGVVNAQDTRFNDLRIWRDLNSDGISQAGELQSLTEAGITAINVAKTENSQPLANGNLLADIGSYVRNDGSEGGVGSVSAEIGDIDLSENTFYSEFADSIPLTEEAQALPDMNGSGQVRSLREAASLSPEVAAILDQYAQATTRSAQLALLDQLIVAWGETSALAVTGDGAYDGAETTVSIAGHAEGSAGYEAWMTKLQTLERFNGRTFAAPTEGAVSVSINLFGGRQNFLNQSWAALRQSVYDGLLLQTRLKPYMDTIMLKQSDHGVNLEFCEFVVGFDFTGFYAALSTRFEGMSGEAVRDLLDLQRIAGIDLNGMGWDGYGQLRGWLAETVDSTDPTLNATLIAALGDFGYPGLQTDGSGTNASEAVIGDDAGATLNGEAKRGQACKLAYLC